MTYMTASLPSIFLDSRIDVAAGNGPDGVDHRQQRQSEGKGDAFEANMLAGKYSAANPAEDKHECPD